MISSIDKVNDDATFDSTGYDYIQPGQSIMIEMGNHSFLPKGTGFNLTFSCNGEDGGIKLDVPGVGPHSFTYENQSAFSYEEVYDEYADFCIKVNLA